MRFLRLLFAAAAALRRNILRSALTTLGIVIGVGSVIAMMEIGNGSTEAIRRTIASMGANQLIVIPGAAASSGTSFGSGSGTTLTPGDAEAIARECPAVRIVAPVIRLNSKQVIYGNRNWVPSDIQGSTPDLIEVRDWKIAEGDNFQERDVTSSNRVCLLGQTVVNQLFGEESPLGQEIRMKNVSFRVIGVLGKKGANMMGRDQDDVVLAPWTSLKYRVSGNNGGGTSGNHEPETTASHPLYPSQGAKLYPEISAVQKRNSPLPLRLDNIDQIICSAVSQQDIPVAIQQITELLNERHRIADNEPGDFTIRDMAEITKMMSSTSILMTKLLLIVAAISLVVGGIGIMNIMLVSVTERTKEIGLRMAIGARAGDIMRQFLTESVVLCLGGGLLGILFGRTCSTIVASVLNWPIVTSVAAIVVSVSVSAVIGVLFGFYPAWKASRLDPIEALRYE